MSFYYMLHLISLFSVIACVGGLAGMGVGSSGSQKVFSIIAHTGLIVMFVAGFGLMARLGVQWPWPLWIWIKLACWLILGGLVAFMKRSSLGAPIKVLVLLVPLCAVVFALVYRPTL